MNRILTLSSTPQLEGSRVFLRPPMRGDYRTWARLREASRDFLSPWEPSWPNNAHSLSAYRLRLRRYKKENRKGLGYTFFIFRRGDRALLDGLSLSHIRRGVSQSGSLGYWMGQAYSGHGYMTEAVSCLITFAFDVLTLHRLEAACLLDNAASIGVLRKCGFHEEGIARRYLEINGIWRDHRLFAILPDDPRPLVQKQ
ncbi:MAG: GNAT family protein [Alphaproteobacteria bacterium]